MLIEIIQAMSLMVFVMVWVYFMVRLEEFIDFKHEITYLIAEVLLLGAGGLGVGLIITIWG